MEITFFHVGAIFFGSVTIYNLHSSRKYGESYIPAIAGSMMFISLLLFIILPWQYGYIALIFTMIFAVVNYSKSKSINKEKMERFVKDSKVTEPLKLTDYFMGWKVLHRLNEKYGPKKASFIYSVYMWLFGVILIIVSGYLWPDIFSNVWLIGFIVTGTMVGFYWQNKKLLEDLDSHNSE